VNVPALPFKPLSVSERDDHFQSPASPTYTRARQVWPPSKKAWTVLACLAPEGGTNVTVARVSKGVATDPAPVRTTSGTPNLAASLAPVVKWAARAVGPLASRHARSRPPQGGGVDPVRFASGGPAARFMVGFPPRLYLSASPPGSWPTGIG